jgi:hypothetical protein
MPQQSDIALLWNHIATSDAVSRNYYTLELRVGSRRDAAMNLLVIVFRS